LSKVRVSFHRNKRDFEKCLCDNDLFLIGFRHSGVSESRRSEDYCSSMTSEDVAGNLGCRRIASCT
jgi:hypothetical protein